VPNTYSIMTLDRTITATAQLPDGLAGRLGVARGTFVLIGTDSAIGSFGIGTAQGEVAWWLDLDEVRAGVVVPRPPPKTSLPCLSPDGVRVVVAGTRWPVVDLRTGLVA
jgi:hypothetical protein